jgi:hypothetical protein
VGFLKILVWSPAEKYESVLKEQIEFFRKTKHLWKEQ